MPWYIIALIVYICLDRLLTVGLSGRRPPYTIEMTPAYAVASLITGALIIWALVSATT